MIYFASLDEDGYMTGYTQYNGIEKIEDLPEDSPLQGVPYFNDIQLEDLKRPTEFLAAYRWEDGEWVLNITREKIIKNEFQIMQLKEKLEETDYVATKIAEGAATEKDYNETVANRIMWRAEINDLEAENEELKS